MKRPGKYLLILVLAAVSVGLRANADTFVSAHYDAKSDRLVVTMLYRGTNPNHTFKLQWGECQNAGNPEGSAHVAADVLDDQWDDAAIRDYRRTVKFGLQGLRCRPRA